MNLRNLFIPVAMAATIALAGVTASADPITAVSPNDTSGTYPLIDDGLNNGVAAHTDGGTWEDLPTYLIGADYIQTFNSDNSNSDLDVELTFDQPSFLYIFHSDNVDDPSWLTTDFTDTGDNLTRSGSVTYSVWSQQFAGTGSTTYTTLDNDPNTTNSEEMYGIAARAGTNPIPEPATLSLIGLGGLALLRRRRQTA